MLLFELLLHEELVCEPVVAVLHLVYVLHVPVRERECFRLEWAEVFVTHGVGGRVASGTQVRVGFGLRTGSHGVLSTLDPLLELQFVSLLHDVIDGILEGIEVVVVSDLSELVDELLVGLRLRLLQRDLLLEVSELLLGDLGTVHL